MLGVVGLVFSIWLLADGVRDVERVGASAEADPALVRSSDGGSGDTGSPTASEPSASTTTEDDTGVGFPPPADLPREGPGITQPGVLLAVSPSRGGAFDVWERVRLSDPVDNLTLSPPDVSRAGTMFGGAEAVVTMVQLDVDGELIQVPGGVVDGKLDVPVNRITQFQLSYRLDGTSVRSLPSTARRALGAISPLLDDTPYNLPVSVVVDGPVLGVGCPLLDLSDRACALGTSQRMQVARNLPFDDAVVTVQFDLGGE